MTDTPDKPDKPASTPEQSMHAVDHLICAFEKSGMQTFTEAGPKAPAKLGAASEGIVYLTVRDGKKRTDGTIGPVLRFSIETDSGKICGLQVM